MIVGQAPQELVEEKLQKLFTMDHNKDLKNSFFVSLYSKGGLTQTESTVILYSMCRFCTSRA